MSQLTSTRKTYKPFQYPWAYDYFLQSEQMHWLPTELDFTEDIEDWKTKMTESEKKFISHVLRFFTQGDIDIAAAYINNYMPVFVAPELRMMLSSFAAREATHIAAYSHLIESLGLPETTYSEFFQYEEMRKKHDYMASFIGDSPETIAQQLAVFSAFGEGLQLFSSFAMLVNPSRFGKLKGVGQIIAWSQADESLHTEAMIRLFRTLVEENPDIWTDVLKKDIYDACRSMVDLEDAFIDLSFGMTDQEGLSREELKHYIRYIADRRLISLGMKTEYGVSRNPLPWMEGLLGVTQTNFFEQRAVDYAKGALTGSWKDVWKNTEKI